ncbi:MAG: hypothetical protein FWB80_05760 [Defluviitaleaceae bacterium]|nr:hypothetical protein [Defluviitaleaceae bacterium]
MKKFLVIFIAVALLAGCGSQGGDTEERTPVDIDMTQMSVTMVSAQAAQLEFNPTAHLGQVVRIRGSHYTFYWEMFQANIHYIVLDLTVGCCGAAFEFILSDELIETVGYPPHGAIIEIVGTYKYYEVANETFHFFAVTEITVKE